MSTPEPDWMNLDQLPAVGIPQDAVEANPKYQALQAAIAELNPQQQEFVYAMPVAHFVAAKALRNMKAAGSDIGERTMERYATDPAVKRVIDMYREFAGSVAGIDALSVMLRVEAWADYCEELVPTTDNNGAVLLDKDGSPRMRKRDIANGLKALELLGRHTKALGNDSETAATQARPGPGLSITFIHNVAAPQTVRVGEIIDAEIINVPTPKEIGK